MSLCLKLVSAAPQWPLMHETQNGNCKYFCKAEITNCDLLFAMIGRHISKQINTFKNLFFK